MNTKIKQIINQNSAALEASDKNFEALYTIMFNQDAILAEDNDGFGIHTYTYSQVKAQIEEVSCALYKKIGANHTFVALEMENCVQWLVAFWAILRSGNKPYLVNCRHPQSLANTIIKRLDIKYIIGLTKTSLDAEFICISDLTTSERFDGDFENEIAFSTSATSLKDVICFYSGASLCAQILNVKSFIGDYPEIASQYKGRIKQLAFLPFYHVFGLIAVYFWFAFFGQTIVFMKNYTADTILKTCKKHEVTHIFAVPVLWHTIENTVQKKLKEKGEKTVEKFRKGLNLCTSLQNVFPNWGMKVSQKIMSEVTDELFGNSVRFCINGGSYIRQSALEMFNGIGYNLHNGYGMSELGITSVEFRTRPKHKNLNSVGKPFASVEYKINPDGVLLVNGTSICDKLWIEGKPVVMDQWFNTGDNMELKDDHYYIRGRLGDMIIGESGENINPDVIEQNFVLPEAENYCVIGLGEKDNILVSMVVQTNKYMSVAKRNALLDKIIETNEKLPVTSRVQRIYYTTDQIVSNGAIKVSRAFVLRGIENGSITLNDFKKCESKSNSDDFSCSPEILRCVKEIIAKNLDISPEDISPDAHLMLDLGADSMQYFAILTDLAEEFSLSSSEKETLRYTTNDICQYIERHI